jgi:hypothetical protein
VESDITLSAFENASFDAKKWKPVFQRNQVYADCARLSAIKFTQIAHAYLQSSLRRLRTLICGSQL